MASPTVPYHGKTGNLYILRPNGFQGSGLNDVTWGVGSTAADLTYYEVEIDSELGGGGGVDTFQWRVNGGAWTTDVDITGAAQVLADAQAITFAATVGHTLGDQWVIGNLKDEATTVVDPTAQITDATARLLNPNAPPVWTPTNAVNLVWVNYTNGTAIYNADPGVTTVTGNNGYIPTIALQKVAYLLDWSLNVTLEMADTTVMQDDWKSALAGQAEASGSANAYFVATETLLYNLQETIGGGDKYFLLELYNYDPDNDQTGDHINIWAVFTGFAIPTTYGSVVKETVNFQAIGGVSFTANV